MRIVAEHCVASRRCVTWTWTVAPATRLRAHATFIHLARNNLIYHARSYLLPTLPLHLLHYLPFTACPFAADGRRDHHCLPPSTPAALLVRSTRGSLFAHVFRLRMALPLPLIIHTTCLCRKRWTSRHRTVWAGGATAHVLHRIADERIDVGRL